MPLLFKLKEIQAVVGFLVKVIRKWVHQLDRAALTSQITLYFALSMFVVLLTTTVCISLYGIEKIEQHFKDQGLAVTQLLSKELEYAVLYNNEKRARKTVSSYSSFEEISQVEVINHEDHQLLYEHHVYEPWIVSGEVLSSPKAKLEAEDDRHWQFVSSVVITPDYDINFPGGESADNELVYGTVRVLFSKHKLFAASNAIKTVNVLICTFLGLMGTFFLARMLKKTAKPLSELTDAMQDVEKGHHLTVPPSGAKEIRYITNVFNNMMVQLERRERDLTIARDNAVRASRLKSEFVANVSHEIRTPMNGVLGMLNLLEQGDLSVEQQEYLADAKVASDNLLSLINGILDFSKLSVEKVELESTAVNLYKLVEQTIALHAPSASPTITFACLYSPAIPQMVLGDPTRLQQILSNLLSNAVKFTTSGSIVVTVRPCTEVEIESLISEAPVSAHVSAMAFPAEAISGSEDMWLEILVQDTGKGIPDSYKPNVFEAYSQQDGSISRHFGGTGLGLAITKKLVGLMRGSIFVESIEGEGSTFHLLLPFKPVLERPTGLMPVPLRQYFQKCLLLAPSGLPMDAISSVATLLDLPSQEHKLNTDIAVGEKTSDKQWILFCQAVQACKPDKRVLVLINDVSLDNELLIVLADLKKRCSQAVVVYYSAVISAVLLDDAQKQLINMSLPSPVRFFQLQEKLCSLLSEEAGLHRLPNSIFKGNSTADAIEKVVDYSREQFVSDNTVVPHILVVEDNIINQRVAKATLEKLGCRVTLASNGQEALDKVAQVSFDLVFMDCQMPVMDGFSATKEIRSQGITALTLPIVALSANTSEQDKQHCFSVGMNDFIAKPFKRQEVENILNKWLPTPIKSAIKQVH